MHLGIDPKTFGDYVVFAEARVSTVTIKMVQLYGFHDFVLVCLPKIENHLLHVKCDKEQCHAEKSLHLGRRLDQNKLIEFSLFRLPSTFTVFYNLL